MKKNFLSKTSLLLFVGTSLISCSPIQKLAEENNVVLLLGVDFETAKRVAIDAETGKEVLPCIQTGGSNQDYQFNESKKGYEATDTKNSRQECETELILEDNPTLKTALELSKKPIQGTIRKNGKEIPAQYIVGVTAVYRSSHCNTDSSGGDQHERCGRSR